MSDWKKNLKENELLLPGIGESYFPGATGMVNFFNSNGLNARKLYPNAGEMRMHFSIYVDFNAIAFFYDYIKDPGYQVFLSVLGNFIYDNCGFGKKDYPSLKDNSVDPTRDELPKINFLACKGPEGPVATLRFAGDVESYKSFAEADHEALFGAIFSEEKNLVSKAKENLEVTKTERYCSLSNYDVYHRPDCGHVKKGERLGLPSKLVWYPSAEIAVKNDKRPCRFCRPPWSDADKK